MDHLVQVQGWQWAHPRLGMDMEVGGVGVVGDGTDTGEALEIEAAAGFDLTGWQLVLYNGANNSVYNTATLSGTVPAAGVVVRTYPTIEERFPLPTPMSVGLLPHRRSVI